MRYTVISSSLQTFLATNIQKLVAHGWKLQGGVSFYNGVYYQALTKDDE